MSRAFSLVVALDDRFGIGKASDLPWKLPGDMRHFVAVTRGPPPPQPANAVIMGRVTWDSIPERFCPLAGRKNIVLTTGEAPGAPVVAHSFNDALAAAEDANSIFVIGGAAVYRQAIAHPHCSTLHLTRVEGDFDCDSYFPDPALLHHKVEDLGDGSDGGIRYRFERWERLEPSR